MTEKHQCGDGDQEHRDTAKDTKSDSALFTNTNPALKNIKQRSIKPRKEMHTK